MSKRLAVRSFVAAALLLGVAAVPAFAERPSQTGPTVPGNPHGERLCGYTPTLQATGWDGYSLTVPPGTQPLTLATCRAELDALILELSQDGFVINSSSCMPVYCRK